MHTLDRYFTIFLIAFAAAFIVLGIAYYEYSWPVLRFPLGAGLAVILLGGASLWRSRQAATPAPAGVHADEDTGDDAGQRRTQLWHGIAWIAAILPMIFIAGYVIGLPLYTFLYMKLHGQSWRLSTVLSLGTLVLVYIGFVKVLGVPLPIYPIGLDR